MNKYDAIVIGAGHNGLTNGAYLAKAGLKVAVLERNPYIGGATVSRELHKGWYYSNCSYVASLLRPENTGDLGSKQTGNIRAVGVIPTLVQLTTHSGATNVGIAL